MNKFIIVFILFFAGPLLAQEEANYELQSYQQSMERKRVQKRKVREKNYSGARIEGELAVQPDIKTSKEKRKLEKENRQGE